MEYSIRRDLCKIDIHRESFAKYLRSKKHLENIRQIEIIIPEWLFKEEQGPIRKNWLEKIYNPKTLKQIARENIKLNHTEIDK